LHKELKPAIKIYLQIVSDAALMFKGLQHTFVALKLPTVSHYPNSPMSCREFCGFEGSDKWNDYNQRAKHSIDQINAFIDGGAQLGGYDFHVVSGGDQANVHAMLCLGSCNAEHPCAYCECTKHEMNSSEQQFTSRTRQGINILAHTAVGYCKGCSKELGEGDLAKPGDSIPAWFKGTDGQWKNNHFSVEYGKHCLLHVEAIEFLICILHTNLCIVKGLWEETILANLDLVKNSSLRGSQADEIHSILQQVHVFCKYSKLKKKSKNVSANKHLEQLRSHSFHGRDAQNLCIAIARVIDVVFDPVSKDPLVVEKNESVHEVWAAWGDVWKLLNTYFVDTTENRLKHADTFTKLVTKFLISRDSQCLKKQGLYLHILQYHVRTQIIQFGCLAPFQAQGLEHCNKIRKEIMHKQTNGRVTQTHAAVDGLVSKKAGKSRIQQVQEVVLIKSLLTNTHEQKIKTEHTSLAREARHKRKSAEVAVFTEETRSKRAKVQEEEEEEDGEG
jgi:hypothetical protein